MRSSFRGIICGRRFRGFLAARCLSTNSSGPVPPPPLESEKPLEVGDLGQSRSNSSAVERDTRGLHKIPGVEDLSPGLYKYLTPEADREVNDSRLGDLMKTAYNSLDEIPPPPEGLDVPGYEHPKDQKPRKATVPPASPTSEPLWKDADTPADILEHELLGLDDDGDAPTTEAPDPQHLRLAMRAFLIGTVLAIVGTTIISYVIFAYYSGFKSLDEALQWIRNKDQRDLAALEAEGNEVTKFTLDLTGKESVGDQMSELWNLITNIAEGTEGTARQDQEERK